MTRASKLCMLVAAAVCLLVLLVAPRAQAHVFEHMEDFTTKDYCDTLNTTADWNTAAGELRPFPFELTYAGSILMGNDVQDIAVVGDHAYLAIGASGLLVVDISDSSGPTAVGTGGTAGMAQGVAVDGDNAFVACGAAGLQVVDVSTSTGPWVIGSCGTTDAADVVVAGNHAFVADSGSGLRVVDVTSPASPSVIGTCDTPGLATGVAVDGDRAYVADFDSGLQIIDITDTANPVILGNVSTSGSAREVVVSGDLVYIAQGTAGIVVVDVTDASSPVLLSEYDTMESATDVAVTGNWLYVTDWGGRLAVLDVTDPADPKEWWHYSCANYAGCVVLAGEHAYLGIDGSGFHLVDICDLTDMKIEGSCSAAGYSGYAKAVDVDGDYAYVCTSGGDLLSVSIADPASPVVHGSCPVSTAATVGMDVEGDHAFVVSNLDAFSYVLTAIDVADPAAPAIVGSVSRSCAAEDVVVSGDLAFVARQYTILFPLPPRTYAGIHVVDLSDPANPTVIAVCGTSEGWVSTGLAVAGDNAYLTAWRSDGSDALHIFDVTDPENPTLVGNCGVYSDPLDVAVAGDMAYVVCEPGVLSVVDITDPTVPVLLGNHGLPTSAGGVSIVGDFLVVRGEDAGAVHLVDISDPTDPTVLGSLDTPGWTHGLAADGDHAFVTDHDAGLLSVRFLQRLVNPDANVGVSLDIYSGDWGIVGARVVPTEVDSIRWRLSSDGGTSWNPVPAHSWGWFSTPSTDLRWRSEHINGGLNENPVCDELRVQWLYETPSIESITDVPNDQGGQVTIRWIRTGYDARLSPTPVTEYRVYREMETLKAGEEGQSEGAVSTRVKLRKLEATERPDRFPPGDWEYITSVPACCEQEYAVIAPTLADSTEAGGTHYSVFFLSAVTNTPSVYYDSPPDSGYSVDNLVPSVPGGFAVAYAAHANDLSWDESSDPDFAGFHIYRALDPEFTAAPENLVHTTTETAWTDGVEEGWQYHYKISAIDLSGNESDAVPPESTTGLDGPVIPEAFALHQNTPNPITGSTTIRYDVPTAAGHIKLRVFDASGRLVRTLLDGEGTTGRNGIFWDGTDERGRRVASGVYYYRLETEHRVMIRKTVVLR